MNFSSTPQTVDLGPAVAGKNRSSFHTLLTDAPDLPETLSNTHLTLPPYGSWIGSMQ